MIIFRVLYDLGGSNKSLGARFGPMAIERAFSRWNWRGTEDGILHPELSLSWISYIHSLERYRQRTESVFTKRKRLDPFITLSGDNSCSFETVRAVRDQIGHIALAVLDAHPDACVPGHDPHADWVWRLWNEGIVMPEKTIFFGIRDPEKDEAAYIKEKRATVIGPDEIYRSYAAGINSVAPYTALWQLISAHALVIVVDIDVLDPAYAPGTGVLRAGGLGVRHVLYIIQQLSALPFAVKIGEICEVIPEEGNKIRPKFDQRPDPCGLTVLAADAIFREMIRSISA